jgi:hypothetical protein
LPAEEAGRPLPTGRQGLLAIDDGFAALLNYTSFEAEYVSWIMLSKIPAMMIVSIKKCII